MNAYSKKKGFTVVELVIAIAILVIVGAMTSVIFRATQQSFINAKAFQHIVSLARQTVARMHNEIQSMYIGQSGLVQLVGIDEGGTHFKVDAEADALYFAAPDNSQREGEVVEIGYWQRDDGNIMRHIDTMPDFDFQTAERDDELGLVIEGLDFKYHDGNNFIDAWDSRVGAAQEGSFPKAIKFSFFVSDEGNLVKKKFESLVRIASTAR